MLQKQQKRRNMVNKLFNGVAEEKKPELLRKLEAQTRQYEKGQYIALQGEPFWRAGIVLSGRVRVQKETDKAVFIINDYKPDTMFGEALTFAENAVFPFNIVALAKSKILYLNLKRAEGVVLDNLLKLLAERVLFFNRKIDALSFHSIRDRLLCFFEPFYARHGNNWFSVPYNRNSLAEYLSVNRSALSREISNMKRDGILESDKNKFKICIPLFKKL